MDYGSQARRGAALERARRAREAEARRLREKAEQIADGLVVRHTWREALTWREIRNLREIATAAALAGMEAAS